MKSRSDAKEMHFTEGPLLLQIIRFSLPVIATGVLQLLFHTADSVVVGRWGGSTPDACETALAAVGSCGSLINLLVNFALGLSVGTGVCAAKAIGAKDNDTLHRIAHTSIVLACLIGVLISAVGILFARPLLVLMGTDSAVLNQAVPYLVAYFLGTPANLLFNFAAAVLRANGDTTRPFAFLTFSGAVNFGLNVFMVVVCKLGACGVGIATGISQWLSCILILCYLMGRNSFCRVQLRQLRVHWAECREILAVGIPTGLQSTVFSVSGILIQSSVNSFGKVAMAANSAATTIGDYVYMADYSFFHTTVTFVSQNVGAKNYKRAQKVLWYCAGCVFVLGFTLGMLGLLSGEFLLGIFTPDNPAAIAMGMIRLRILLPSYFLCGVMDVGNACLRGLGKSMTATVNSIIGVCGTRILWILTVFQWVHTPEMLYISFPIAWGSTTLANFAVAIHCLKGRMTAQKRNQ